MQSKVGKVLGVTAGVGVSALVGRAFHVVSGVLFMPTMGPETARAATWGQPLAASVVILGGIGIGTFLGNSITARVARNVRLLREPLILGLFLLAALAHSLLAGHPPWFWAAAVATWLAATASASVLTPIASVGVPPPSLPARPRVLPEPVAPETQPEEEPEPDMPPVTARKTEPQPTEPTYEESDRMAIARIELPEEFELSMKEGALVLPAIQVIPTDPRTIPESPTLEITVSGIRDTGAFVKLLQDAYAKQAGEFRPKSLAKAHTIHPVGLRTTEVLPRSSRLELRVRLTYEVKGGSGKAMRGPALEAVCTMKPGDSLAAWREIVLEPRVMVLSQGSQEFSSIKIKVRPFGTATGPDTGATQPLPKPGLRISRKSQETARELPELLAQLAKASASIQYLPPAGGPESADGIHEFRLSARLDLPEWERKILDDRTRNGPLVLALLVHAPGALPASLTVEVESVAGQFPGQYAVDFGTTNSTITIYEPKEINPRAVPIDQLEEMRNQFRSWLAKAPDQALEGVSESAFERFVAIVAQNLNPDPNDSPLDTLRKRFRPDNSEQATLGMHEAIRQIELGVPHQEASLRRALHVKLHEIYAATFRAFPFRQYNLTTLPLEGSSLDMCSELEITSTRPRIEVRMGSEVRSARETHEITLTGAPPTATGTAVAIGDDPIIAGRFHRVPKRYLPELNREQPGTVRVVRQSGGTELVDHAQILGAAWDHLRSRFDEIRAKFPDAYSRGRVRRAVVTYPTVLGPRARNEVAKLFHDMGVPTVRMLYDEAVAAAIFHLEKFFAGSYEVGPEAFKTRCRRVADIWVQNMLVLDIGGGTTDIAVIRLEMQQEPFKGTDQGAGGRYYTITPTLLGSSGKELLGGEFITIQTFRLLKFALADYVLRYDSALNYPQPLVKARQEALTRLGSGLAYTPGALLHYVAASTADPGFKTAQEIAERLVPTQFEHHPAARVAFQALWREAERIKLALGRRRTPRPNGEDPPLHDTLDAPTVATLLSAAWHEGGERIEPRAKAAPLTLTSTQFELVARPVVEEALRIAKGLVQSTLRKYELDHPRGPDAPEEKLDRIVLSGKSCNLHLVHTLLPRSMRHDCSYYADDVTEVLFEENLAKQATSVGACRAEEMWASLRPPEGWEATSQTGVSSIAFDIRNLFFFLPCSFALKDQNERTTEEIFKVHERFRMLDGSAMGKILSPKWTALQAAIRVYRIDYKDDPGINWGNYLLDGMETALGTSVDEIRRTMRARFEVNHETLIRVLFCLNGQPKYTFNDRAQRVGEADIRPKLVEALKAAKQPVAGDPLQGHPLRFDIAVDPVDDNPTVVIKAGSPFEHEARAALPSLEEGNPRTVPANGQQGHGTSKGVLFALSDPLPKPRANRKYDFYARLASAGDLKWTHLGSVQLPRVTTGFEENWHASISQDGFIRVMQGLPDYWLARTPRDLYDHPGTVLYRDLTIPERKEERDRNPDSGTH